MQGLVELARSQSKKAPTEAVSAVMRRKGPDDMSGFGLTSVSQ